MTQPDAWEYDVALSFAGEDRVYVERVAEAARALGLRVFYDRYEEAGLWGKDLYEHLDWVYRKAAHFCVLFISEAYAQKVWTTHERRSAQARALEEHTEYVLPARFDGTEVPGLRPTVGYLDLADRDPAEVAALLHQKVGPPSTHDYLPPTLDRLLHIEGIEDGDKDGAWIVEQRADVLFRKLGRMSEEERSVLATAMLLGCGHDFPENVHIDLDLLSRETGKSAEELKALMGGLRTLGLAVWLQQDGEPDEFGPPGDTLYLQMEIRQGDEVGGNVTGTLFRMMTGDGLCVDHAHEAVVNRDFAHLSSATIRPGSLH